MVTGRLSDSILEYRMPTQNTILYCIYMYEFLTTAEIKYTEAGIR